MKVIYNVVETSFTKEGLLADTEYNFRVQTTRGDEVNEWSDILKVRTPKESFEYCVWKECPGDVDEKMKYSVDINNPRIATKVHGYYCTIIGNTALPLSKITSWDIKITESKSNDGDGIFIGVAPFDIDQNDYNHFKCGWYFYCYYSTLCSGPPHKYTHQGKVYGPKKEEGEYVHTGDSVGVVMNTARGELSFTLNGMNYGVAYKGIPFDKPLVPCVILKNKGNSVEFIINKE